MGVAVDPAFDALEEFGEAGLVVGARAPEAVTGAFDVDYGFLAALVGRNRREVPRLVEYIGEECPPGVDCRRGVGLPGVAAEPSQVLGDRLPLLGVSRAERVPEAVQVVAVFDGEGELCEGVVGTAEHR